MSDFVDFQIDNLALDQVTSWDGQSSFKLLAEGQYIVEVTDVKQSMSKNNNPTLVLTYQVVSEDENGHELERHYALTDKAKGRVRHILECMGLPIDRIQGSTMLGRQIMIQVTHETKPYLNPMSGLSEERTNMNVFESAAEFEEDEAPAPAPAPAPVAAAAPAARRRVAARTNGVRA